MATILKLIVVAFLTLCVCLFLLLGWLSYLHYKFRKAGTIKPREVVATDVVGLLPSLFHSPWFCLSLGLIAAAAVLLGRLLV